MISQSFSIAQCICLCLLFSTVYSGDHWSYFNLLLINLVSNTQYRTNAWRVKYEKLFMPHLEVLPSIQCLRTLTDDYDQWHVYFAISCVFWNLTPRLHRSAWAAYTQSSTWFVPEPSGGHSGDRPLPHAKYFHKALKEMSCVSSAAGYNKVFECTLALKDNERGRQRLNKLLY